MGCSVLDYWNFLPDDDKTMFLSQQGCVCTREERVGYGSKAYKTSVGLTNRLQAIPPAASTDKHLNRRNLVKRK